MITPKQIERAKRNIESADWAREWFDEAREVADHIVAQDDGYIDSMISELTPTNPYGITCPNCVGRLSQEGSLAYGGIKWDYKQPDHMTCEACGQTLPDAKYPETGKLALPRSGQTLTHFLTPAEKAHPDDRSGKYAWKWYGTPIHVSFDGIIREKKDAFMIGATRKLAVVYALTGDARYAAKAIAILERLAHCYRNWLYHDYFDGYADCDPMWAAWHAEEKGLFPLEWKRCAVAAHYEKDDVDSASMLSNYWGSGRLHPSCDSIANLVGLCTAYDLVHDAVDAEGRPLWTDAARAQVERDLLLEYMMGAEAWLGGHLEAKAGSNKAGRAYCSVAAIGKTLGLPDYADTALRGYELLRDVAFISDGFSRESPFYTFDGFMSPLVRVPEILDGYAWPDGYEKRSGVVRVFDTDPKLRLIFRAMLESQRPDGRHIPLSDTREPRGPNMNMVEVALHHYPDLYRGRFLMLRRDRDPGEFSLFNNDADTMAAHVDTPLPEILFPDWKAAILRHGSGPDAACLALAFNDAGVHMHNDSLNLFYAGGGHTILGDQGYISDAPTIHWGHSTMSHNLVIVDGEEQPQKDRRPSLRMMATSPMASFVEAESFVYEQCSAYRRLVVMVKGPDGHTFAVDVFRVRGGRSHDWRAYSEIASNIAQGTARTFEGIDMPDEPDVPNFGGSVEREHLFGLRDVVTAKNASGGWHATWQQADRAYRLHMLTDAAKVQASNGPGQRDESETGRRVRYLDVIREGSDLSSTFIAVHEPSVGKSTMPIRKVVLLGVPDGAGENAVALRVESDWGTYLLLSEFDNEATVDRVRFKGTLGLVRTHEDGSRDMLSYRSSTLIVGGIGFEDQPASWTGTVKQQTDNRIETSSPRPANWPDTPRDLRVWVRVGDGKVFTGYPVANTYADAITVERFPLLPVTQVELPAVQYMPADTE